MQSLQSRQVLQPKQAPDRQSSCLSLPIAELLGLVNNGFHREGLVSLSLLTPHPCGDNLSQAHLSRSPTEFHGEQRTLLPSCLVTHQR